MIGKKVKYKKPDDGRWSENEGEVLDKILVEDTNYYLIQNKYTHEVDTVKCYNVIGVVN